MRVLVASDSVGSLSSRQAGQAIATGWPAADLRVLPVGESGAGFSRAYADLLGAELGAAADGEVLVTSAAAAGTVVLQVSRSGGGGLAPTASSWPLKSTSSRSGR